MTLLCIYHKNCSDGFGAALAVNAWAISNQLSPVEFFPANYGDVPPDVIGKDVIIVDFSYPRDILIAMNKQANSLKVIDHHKSAAEDLRGLDFCHFDMSQSGAVLTWKLLFEDRPVPRLLNYIQDRDLWQWKMEDSHEVSAALQLLSKAPTHESFKEWERYLIDNELASLVEQGRAITAYQNQLIETILQSGAVSMIEIAGYTVPCLNATHLISEIGNTLAQDHPFCALYFDTPESRVFSLRSADSGVDVSAIAKQFGGGGHFHAAGFKVEKPPVLSLHDSLDEQCTEKNVRY